MEYLSVKDIADELGVSEALVRREIESKALKAHRIGSDARPVLRVSRAQLNAYLDAKSDPLPPKARKKSKKGTRT